MATLIEVMATLSKRAELVTVSKTKAGKVWARTPQHLGGSGKPWLVGRTKAGNVFCTCPAHQYSAEHEANRVCKHSLKALTLGLV